MSDGVRYQTGLAAEEAVVRAYEAKGADLKGERVRTSAGEIDLIFLHGDTYLFVEVKARKARDTAAASVSRAQCERIVLGAQIWMDGEGLSGLEPCRFDLATVDGQGHVEILENAFGDGF